MSKFGKAFGIDTNTMRVRSFELGGQQFKVRVPLSVEAEEMVKRVDNPSKELVERKYKELTKDLIAKKDTLEKLEDKIKFTKDDVIIGENSMRELAQTQASTEIRIVESIKLLVPVDGTDLTDLTYEDVQSEFPLPVQLTLVKKIAEVISPSYEEIRKN